MGLSITAYAKASLLPKHERTDRCYDEHVIAFAYSCFPRSYRGLADADVVTADNEGAIGPDAAADLLKDFEDGRSRWADFIVAKFPDRAMKSRYYLERYEDWAHACRLAADHGLIDFH